MMLTFTINLLTFTLFMKPQFRVKVITMSAQTNVSILNFHVYLFHFVFEQQE